MLVTRKRAASSLKPELATVPLQNRYNERTPGRALIFLSGMAAGALLVAILWTGEGFEL